MKLTWHQRVCSYFLSLFAGLALYSFAWSAPRPLSPPWPAFGQLQREGFDQPLYFTTNQVIDPTVWRESWSGYALQRSGATVPPWRLPMVVSNSFRLEPERGAIRFWYRPDYSTGVGSGGVATLLQLATTNATATEAWWSLVVSPDGSAVHLVCQKESGLESCLQAEINWAAGNWHMVTLGFTPTNSALFIDDQLAAIGDGLATIPNEAAPYTSLTVGSAATGTTPAQGQIEELSIFSGRKKMQQIMGNPFGLSADWEIGLYYASLSKTAALGPISDEEIAERTARAAQRQAEREALALEEFGGGMQMLLLGGESADCVTNGPVYLTNVVVNLITNDGWTVYFDVAGGTNEVIYDLFTTPSLSSTSLWTWLEPARTCETHWFTNQPQGESYYTILTPGADRDADGLYDGWEWKHFGHLNQSPGDDYDADGVNNGDAYTNNTDPNQIKFAVNFPSRFVNENSIAGSVLLMLGVPEQMAVLVNNTNLETAIWQPFQTNVVVNLGTTDGEYAVLIGLAGHAWDTKRFWHGAIVTRDTVAPQLVVTNPSTSLIAQPVVQLQGYANEPLAWVRYDLTNAAGLQTNLTGCVLHQWLDTNTLTFTTNWFQCYDVGLETNANHFTLRIADLAGNVTTTNLTLTLDYGGDTNAPALAVTWPEENALVAGTNFTLRGQVDDASASVMIELAGSIYAGSVDRAGNFTVAAIPLLTATNELTLIAADAAGNRRTNTHSVRQSSEALTLTPITAEQLAEPAITFTGTVGVSGQTVWVNGQPADVTGTDWTITLPTPADNVVTLNVQTGSALENPTAALTLSVESPPRITPVTYSETYHYRMGSTYGARSFSRTQAWRNGAGGASHQSSGSTFAGGCAASIAWPPHWPDQQTFQGECSCTPGNLYGETTLLPWQNSAATYAESGSGPDEGLVGRVSRRDYVEWQAQTVVSLRAGGGQTTGQRLLRLTASAAAFSTPPPFAEFDADIEINYFEAPGDVPIPADQIQLFGQPLTPTATNAYVGELFISLPAGSTNDLPITVTTADSYTFTVQAEEAKIVLQSVMFPTNGIAYRLFLDDDFTGWYPLPHWTMTNSSPVVFVSGSRMEAAVGVNLSGVPTNTPLILKGETSRGFTFWGTNTTTSSNLSVAVIADQPLAASKVDYFNPLIIRWSVAAGNGRNFFAIGTSTNQTYVTLRANSLDFWALRHTVAHLSCANPGATDDDQAVANTWAFFAGPANVKTWNGIPLTYYGTTNGGNNTIFLKLLENRDGQCYAFAELFYIALKLNGVTNAQAVSIEAPIELRGFGVKNISFNGSPAYPAEPEFKYDKTNLNITISGIPGQNMDPPQAKLFENHRIVLRNGIYYDPSYGVITPNAASYTTNVGAWMRDDGQWRDAAGATNVLRFF